MSINRLLLSEEYANAYDLGFQKKTAQKQRFIMHEGIYSLVGMHIFQKSDE